MGILFSSADPGAPSDAYLAASCSSADPGVRSDEHLAAGSSVSSSSSSLCVLVERPRIELLPKGFYKTLGHYFHAGAPPPPWGLGDLSSPLPPPVPQQTQVHEVTPTLPPLSPQQTRVRSDAHLAAPFSSADPGVQSDAHLAASFSSAALGAQSDAHLDASFSSAGRGVQSNGQSSIDNSVSTSDDGNTCPSAPGYFLRAFGFILGSAFALKLIDTDFTERFMSDYTTSVS